MRTSSNLLFEWSKLTGYEIVVFTSYDLNGETIYHTNVMMCVAEKFAIVCTDAISDADGRNRVIRSLASTGHEFIEISQTQMHHFCGNCLEVENAGGQKFLLMSTGAFNNLSPVQKDSINRFSSILHTDLTHIETYGGGGARCMVAELF